MIVKGLYTSVWDGGIEIVSHVLINIESKEIIEMGDYLHDYDFDLLNLEILDNQYVTIDNVDYPCHQEDEADEGDFWYR